MLLSVEDKRGRKGHDREIVTSTTDKACVCHLNENHTRSSQMLLGTLWISDSLCLSVTSTKSGTLDPRVAVLCSLAVIKLKIPVVLLLDTCDNGFYSRGYHMTLFTP